MMIGTGQLLAVEVTNFEEKNLYKTWIQMINATLAGGKRIIFFQKKGQLAPSL